jgi:hypothetical protein
MDAFFLLYAPVWLVAIVIFFLIIIFNWLGFVFRKKQMRDPSFAEPAGASIIESSLLGLTALLVAFTFSMAASKFEKRREIIVEEANHIGTAILRCDLYPDSIRSLLRADFHQYVEARIASYEVSDDEQKMRTALDTAAFYSGRIWKRVAALAHDEPGNRVRYNQMIPALNNMIDIVATRTEGSKAKVPRLILWVVLLFSLLSAFLSGYGNKAKRQNFLMIGAFAFMTTVSLYLIMELDRPKQGLINLDVSEQTMLDLRKMFEE